MSTNNATMTLELMKIPTRVWHSVTRIRSGQGFAEMIHHKEAVKERSGNAQPREAEALCSRQQQDRPQVCCTGISDETFRIRCRDLNETDMSVQVVMCIRHMPLQMHGV